jgi:hypothetical protein
LGLKAQEFPIGNYSVFQRDFPVCAPRSKGLTLRDAELPFLLFRKRNNGNIFEKEKRSMESIVLALPQWDQEESRKHLFSLSVSE